MAETNDGSAMSVADEIADAGAEIARRACAPLFAADSLVKTQVARHPDRPHAKHYVARLITDFTPLAGDRQFR